MGGIHVKKHEKQTKSEFELIVDNIQNNMT